MINRNKNYSADDCIVPPVATVMVIDEEGVKVSGQYFQCDLEGYLGVEVMVFKLKPDVMGVCLASNFIGCALAQYPIRERI